MNHQQAIEVLESLLPRMKEEGRPEQVLLKYASDRNLAPAQLEKMAQIYNTAATLTYLEKSEDRGGSFHVIDTPPLLQEYTRYTPVEKAASETPETPGAHNPLRFPRPMEKAASAVDELLASLEPEGPSASKLRQLEEWQKQASEREQEMLLEFIDTTGYRINEGAAGILKIARGDNEASREVLEGDIMYLAGPESGAWAVERIWGAPLDLDMDKVASERDFSEELRTDPLRLEALGCLRDMLEKRAELEVAVKYGESLGKSASFFQEGDTVLAQDRNNYGTVVSDREDKAFVRFVNNETGAVESKWLPHDILRLERNAGDTGKKYNPRKGGGGQGSSAESRFDQALNQARSEVFGGGETPPESAGADEPKDDPEIHLPPLVARGEPNLKGIDDLTNWINNKREKTPWTPIGQVRGILRDSDKPSINRSQMKVDESRGETERSLVLARLMQVDPIISEADPEMVQELYNTLQEASPEYVRDPAKLRMALREAVQYESVPLHTLKEIADTRKTLAQARNFEGELSDREYKV